MIRANKHKKPTGTGLRETQRAPAQDDSPSNADVSLPIETCGRCSEHPVGVPHSYFELDRGHLLLGESDERWCEGLC
jgi:hypothetical protein